jgi:hypothetical protein
VKTFFFSRQLAYRQAGTQRAQRKPKVLKDAEALLEKIVLK